MLDGARSSTPFPTPCLLHPFHLAVPELCQLKKREKYSLKAEKYVLLGRLSGELGQGGSLSDSCEGLLRRGKGVGCQDIEEFLQQNPK